MNSDHKKAIASTFITKIANDEQVRRGSVSIPQDQESSDGEYQKALETGAIRESLTLAKDYLSKQDYIISSSNVHRLRFEFLCCMLVAYDCVMLPFDLAFDLHSVLSPRTMLLHVLLSYLIRVVYLIDFCLGFRKAYIDERVGTEIRDPKVIAKSYLKFYFWVDFLSVVPFDLVSRSFALYCVQLLKIIRLFRLG
jgi:potassium voltage-gated channel Eag-related subfamily H protein 7